VKTPLGAPLMLPNPGLAEAVAEEWRAQGEKIMPATMHLTRLTNTAIDRVIPDRCFAENEILKTARNDVICYRADAPAELVVRQREAWDPLLVWADREYGAMLAAGTGIGFIEQPDAAMEALRRTLAPRVPFALTGLTAAATLCSSAIIALALADGADERGGVLCRLEPGMRITKRSDGDGTRKPSPHRPEKKPNSKARPLSCALRR